MEEKRTLSSKLLERKKAKLESRRRQTSAAREARRFKQRFLPSDTTTDLSVENDGIDEVSLIYIVI